MRLLEEALAACRIAGDLWADDFDRDSAAEPRIARAEDLAQPARADPLEDLVVSEALDHGSATIILTGPGGSLRQPRPGPWFDKLTTSGSVKALRPHHAEQYTTYATTTHRRPLTVTYTSLLRNNRNFRLIYIGQTISQLGDWFNAVAVFALLLDLTGSATAVAWMMIVQFLPVAVVGPLAGVVVDRVDRRRLMIVTDLLRGSLVLVLLVIRRPDQVWIAYVVMAFIVGAQGFFEPARTATIPNITSAGRADAGQRAVERDVVGNAGDRRIDRRPGDGAGRPQRRVRRQCRVVLCVRLFHRANEIRLDAGRRAAADRGPRASRASPT